MPAFDFKQIRRTVEFGLGLNLGVSRGNGDKRTFCLIMADGDVQNALREMAVTTWVAMQKLTSNPPRYEP